jgi:plastocyanin
MAKSKPINVLLGVLTLVAVLAIAPSAFADSAEVDIAKGAGASANADCVSANNCFNPNPVTVAPGTEVEWKNTDTVGHTVTSGKPTDNDAGSLFDSSIIKAGGDFKFTFQNPGTFDYFCQVHPWMTGQVIVSTSTSSTTSSSSTMSGNMSMSSGTTSTTPSTTSNQQAAPSVAVTDNVTAASTTTSTPSTTTSTPSTTTSTPSTTTSTPSTTTESTISSSSSQSNTAPSNTQSSMSGDQMTGWGVGIAVIAIMSGIGIWSAVRRR